MLAKRLIATILIKDNLLVKGKQFVNDRRVGSLLQSIRVWQKREIDEIVIFDIDATKEGRTIDYEVIGKICDECFMPVSFGGGIKSIDQIDRFLRSGADKVVIGNSSITNKILLFEASKRFGSQALSVTVDYRGESVFGECGTKKTNKTVLKEIKEIEKSGAGEIILQCIERDGMMTGYDIDTIYKVCNSTNLPVVCSGGAGSYNDFLNAFNAGCSGAAAGSMWLFTQNTPKQCKEYLKSKGINIR